MIILKLVSNNSNNEKNKNIILMKEDKDWGNEIKIL